jgi:hypothetical protein
VTEEESVEPGAVITKLVGVYHANGSWRGELVYLAGRLTGRAHCALCDITHGPLGRRRSFDTCAAALPVAFDLVHLDERTDQVTGASEGRTPCILAQTDDAMVLLLGADDLAACNRDPTRLLAAIQRAADTRGLRWPDLGSTDEVSG